MDYLAKGIRQAIAGRAWYAALALALAVPSICAHVTYGRDSKEKYAQWFDEYVGHDYRFMRRSHDGRRAWSAKLVDLQGSGAAAGKIEAHFRARPEVIMVEEAMLTGADVYALRCAYLHEGSEDTSGRSSAIDRFAFIEPAPPHLFHCNSIGTKLVLQIDIFAEHISAGLEAWFANLELTEAVRARLDRHLLIQKLSGSTIA